MPMATPGWYAHGETCPVCHEEHLRCGDHDKWGAPCGARPLKDGWQCKAHRRGQQRLALPDPDELIQTYAGIEAMMHSAEAKTAGMDPADSVRDALNRANAMVVVMRTLIGSLAPRAKFTTTWIGEDGPRPQLVVDVQTEGLVGPDHQGDLKAHPWVVLYREWVTIQSQLATKASDLGLVERQVQVQEAYAEVFATSVLAILADLGIDPHSDRAMPIIQKHLLSLDTRILEVSAPSLTAAATSS